MTAFGVVAIATKNQHRNDCALCGTLIEVQVSTVGVLVFCDQCFWLLLGRSQDRERLQNFVKIMRRPNANPQPLHLSRCESCEYAESHSGDKLLCTLCAASRTCPHCLKTLK